ncbi:MAG: hypothetical protein R2991_10005 [Thermoanaerobaculia bacterium]
MTRSNRAVREIEERLTAGPKPVPPPDLLESIVDEIPEDLGAGAGDRGSSTPWWKLAAAVVLLVGGGLLARQMMRETSTVTEFVEGDSKTRGIREDDVAAAGLGELDVRVTDDRKRGTPGVVVTVGRTPAVGPSYRPPCPGRATSSSV